MSFSNLHIGLDAGGSNTELLARLSSEEDELHLCGPGANPKRTGMDEAAHVLADLVRQALGQYPGARLTSVCAGVAGAGSEARQQKLAARLRCELGEDATEANLCLVHDARIALEAAFGNESGVIVIAGTGSAVFARTETGKHMRTGGWGYILGDEGSGYALGRAGLRAVARALDGGQSTLLQTLLPDEYGAESRTAFIRGVYDAEESLEDVAVLALEAAEAGDAVATRLLDEQTTLLARQVSWLAEHSTSEQAASLAPRVALFGGLTNNATYVAALRRALHEHLPDWSVQPAPDAPVTGALRLALRQAGEAANKAAANKAAAIKAAVNKEVPARKAVPYKASPTSRVF